MKIAQALYCWHRYLFICKFFSVFGAKNTKRWIFKDWSKVSQNCANQLFLNSCNIYVSSALKWRLCHSCIPRGYCYMTSQTPAKTLGTPCRIKFAKAMMFPHHVTRVQASRVPKGFIRFVVVSLIFESNKRSEQKSPPISDNCHSTKGHFVE
jgi:hypothetical protein